MSYSGMVASYVNQVFNLFENQQTVFHCSGHIKIPTHNVCMRLAVSPPPQQQRFFSFFTVDIRGRGPSGITGVVGREFKVRSKQSVSLSPLMCTGLCKGVIRMNTNLGAFVCRVSIKEVKCMITNRKEIIAELVAN